MEQQEEKKIKVYESQRRQSNSLPLDLASEILLRLPEKSVVRFRCVSKAWSSITTDPYFINLFKARSPRLLLCFRANDKLFVSSIPQHHQMETSNKCYSFSQHIDSYPTEFPEHSFFSATESVQGLICFRGSATQIVFNPSTRRLLTLPKPNMSSNNLATFLGYDPVESKHNVMCIPVAGSSEECRVLTLGSTQVSWRTVKRLKTNLDLPSSHHTRGLCIKGVVYYQAYVGSTEVWVLISFDVRFEKFDKIQLPPSAGHLLIAYQGRLACVDRKPNRKNGIRLWILENAKKHKWSSKDFLATLDHFNGRLGTSCYLKGFTHTGEFIYVVDKFHEPSCLLFYDPLRNSFRRLEGIINDEFVLSNLHRCSLHVFPNHVESRVFL